MEESHECYDNIVIPVSALLQNVCVGFRYSDNLVLAQPAWPSLILQLISCIHCSVLNKIQTIKEKNTPGSSTVFIKGESSESLYFLLLKHFILCPLHWCRWEKNTRNFLLLFFFPKQKCVNIPSSALGVALHMGARFVGCVRC